LAIWSVEKGDKTEYTLCNKKTAKSQIQTDSKTFKKYFKRPLKTVDENTTFLKLKTFCAIKLNSHSGFGICLH